MKKSYLFPLLASLLSIIYSLQIHAQRDTTIVDFSDSSVVQLTGDWEYGSSNKTYGGGVDSGLVGVQTKKDSVFYSANDTSYFVWSLEVDEGFLTHFYYPAGDTENDLSVAFYFDLSITDSVAIELSADSVNWFNPVASIFDENTFTGTGYKYLKIEGYQGSFSFYGYDSADFALGDKIYGRVVLYSSNDLPKKEGVFIRSIVRTSYSGEIPYWSVNELSEQYLKIYPNPTQGELIVTLEEEQELLLHSLDGRILKHYNGTIGENRINLSNLASGVYWLKANTSYAKILKH